MLIQLLSILAAVVPGKVVLIYPCVWRDETSGAQLDLQIYESMILDGYKDRNVNLTYSPCSNMLNYSDNFYMSIASDDNEIQPLAKWNGGVTLPTYNNIYGGASWNFLYENTNIKCIANHSLPTLLNITWTSTATDYYDLPYVSYSVTDQCSYNVKLETLLLYKPQCVVQLLTLDQNDHGFNYFGAINLGMFNFSSITTTNEAYAETISYNPCRDAFICNGYLTQAVIKNTSDTSSNCSAYLSIYAGYGFLYDDTSDMGPIMYNDFIDYLYDPSKQVTQFGYKNGQKCSISQNETVDREFYVYWQCNTLTKYANAQFSADIGCNEILSIDSIHACPDFEYCVYYSEGNMLNLTEFISVNIVVGNQNDSSNWFFYSVCQNALSENMTFPDKSLIFTEPVTTLYNALPYMAGMYSTKSDFTAEIFFSIENVVSILDSENTDIKYYYNSNVNSWVFQYDSWYEQKYVLFTVQWDCGGKNMNSQHFQVISFVAEPYNYMLEVSTDLC